MRGVWSRRRLRVRRDMLDLLADVGAPPRAQAAGWMLGSPQPDAHCQLVLFDVALAVVVEAERASSALHIPFDQLHDFESDVRASGARVYQVWWGPDLPDDASSEMLDDLRRGLAFSVERTRRGEEFASMLEAAVAAQRPDLPRRRDATGAGRAGRPLMEPLDLWAAPFEPRELTESGPPKRGTPCDRLGDVVGEVYRRAAGKSEQRVRAVLERELQAAGMRVTSEYTGELVRSLASDDPGPLKRPLAFMQRSTRLPEQAAPDAELFPPQAFDQVWDGMDAIVDRLLVIPGVSAADWHSCPVIDCDRSLAVTIDPWSEATIERVRQVTGPHAVRFHGLG